MGAWHLAGLCLLPASICAAHVAATVHSPPASTLCPIRLLLCPRGSNWRQDTWSDLQLFMMLNATVFLGGAIVEVGAG